MPWLEFEMLLAMAFERIGYEVERRGGAAADGGVDLVLHEDCVVTLVQCKHWRRQVGVGVVREFYGVMNAEAAEAGIVVTSSAFTEKAQAFAHGKSIELLDGNELKTLLGYVRGESAAEASQTSPMPCPSCDAEMKLRTATRGSRRGKSFWGCSRFPECRGTRSA